MMLEPPELAVVVCRRKRYESAALPPADLNAHDAGCVGIPFFLLSLVEGDVFGFTAPPVLVLDGR